MSRRRTPDGEVLIVKDPPRGRFFRFGEVERFVVDRLTEGRSIDEIREHAEDRFGGSLSRDALVRFVASLDANGLLADGRSGRSTREGPASRKRRVRGSVLYLRFPLFDPDVLVSAVAQRASLLFTRRFVALVAALVLVAACVVSTSAPEILTASKALLKLSSLPMVIAVLVVVITSHEFAHAVTCKRFGGEVREMGFMLFYFQPAFYCNVSDAWLFPEKSRRLWVSFAGVFFELFLWALATLTWRVTAGDTWINHAALIVMTVSGVKSLVNLNPFIKLDGYYVLSDLLDIPNLRKKAFRYVGDATRRCFGLATRPSPPVSARERGIYLAYGAVAAFVSLSLLAYAYTVAGGMLIEMRQPGALALLTGFVGLRTNRYYQRMFGVRAEDDEREGATQGSSGGGEAAEDGSETSSEASVDDARANGAPPSSSRHARSRIRQAAWLALAVALIGVALFGRMSLRIPGPVSILPLGYADVRAGVAGTVSEILIDEGQAIEAGQVVALLSDSKLRADLVETEAEIRETRASLNKLQAGATEEEREVARAAVVRAEDQLDYTRARLDRLEGLLATNAVPRQDVDDARQAATNAENDLASARAELAVVLRGARPEDIQATAARMERLQARRRHIVDQLDRLEVVSPAAGIVATPTRELMLLPGKLIGKGDLIAKIFDYETVAAQIVVSEKEIGEVRVGQNTVFRVRAHPELEFYGRVTRIATSAQGSTSGSDGVVAAGASSASTAGRGFVVTTEVDNASGLLKPGMTGQAKVLAEPRRIVDLIAFRLFRTLRVEVWSWW